MKKPLKLIWIGTDTECVTSGRVYTILGKFREKGATCFFYSFINDKGEEDNGASFLFASIKRR